MQCQDVYTLDAMRWAASVLARYSVELQESGTAVVPLPEAAPRHRVDGTCIHDFDLTTSCYVLRTLRRVRFNEEVTVCSGRGGDRSRLLAETGVRLGSDAMRGGIEGGVLVSREVEMCHFHSRASSQRRFICRMRVN